MSEQGECSPEMMAAPGPEHDRLKPFEGTFRAEVKIWMGPGDPMESTGTMINAFDLGGRFLRQDYQRDATAGPHANFEGRGFWGFNSVSKLYEGFWIDTTSTIMQTESGTLDDSGKVWTMTGEMPDPQGGPAIVKRSVITLQDDDHHKMEMFFVKDGQELKGLEIHYTRVK